MQNNITLKSLRGLLNKCLVMICLLFSVAGIQAQTVVSTASGIDYNGDYSINNPAALVQTFAVNNTNATDIVLTQVDMQMAPYFGNSGASDTKLYYSATSLSGPFTAPGAGWTLIATGSTTVPAALAVIPVITGMNFVIPANTQYRFAIEATKGMAFSFFPTPTPNSFTNGGVTLQVGDFQIAGDNIGYAGLSPTPNVGNTPSFFGGSVTFYPATACTGAPAPGNTVASATTVCPGVNVNLSTSGVVAPGTTGLTYQWQSSSTLAGPYAPIAGATNPTLSTTQTAATYYQVVVTCSGNSVSSTPVQVLLTPSSNCYCDAGGLDPDFEKISNVAYNTIDNPSTSTAPYENFTAISTTVVQSSTLPITITLDNGFNSDQSFVWIDFNHNGSFADPGEKVFTSTPGVGPHTGTITIPTTASLGNARMRVRMHDSSFGGNTTPCGDSDYGQVEDYTVNIQPCVQGVITTNPANTTIACSDNATFTVAATGSVLVYQWEQRISATAPWTNVANGGVFSGANTATLTITGAPVSMSGYQYRVIVSGPCTAIITSAAAILTVTPLVATYSPANAALCAGGSVALSITNTAPPVTQQFCSGPISVAIPDGTFPGPYPASTSVIPVAIPTGAIVTKVSVTLNITHNYVGDIVAVLKAPNGQILNLDALLTATNNGEVDFANTVISPTGTAILGDGVGPFTGTFQADLSGPTFDFFGFPLPGGPIGYTPTTTNWTDLYSTGAGNWTLAMYDAGAPDEGLLTSWCLDISYGAPSTGVWGPTANLGTIFTDPALTTPYNGTDPVSTVYVNPATATTYTLVVTNAVCVSGITTIPVAVNTTIANVVTAATVSGCIDGNTTFSVTADGTGIAYQWQESTDGGTTWNNLTDNGFYSGSTTANLTLTGLDGTEDGNKYRVILSNACNSITSTVASFSVFAVPTVTIATAVTQLYPGITTTLTSTVTPTGAVYQWYRNGVAIPGATSATYTATVDGLGDYTLVAGDVNGCSSTSNTVTISAAPNNILFIYPSPNTGQFQVRYQSLPGNVLPRTLTIYDSKGARVYYKTYDITAPYAAMDVDMTLHATGIYRVELGDRNGNRIKTGSVLIIKQ